MTPSPLWHLLWIVPAIAVALVWIGGVFDAQAQEDDEELT